MPMLNQENFDDVEDRLTNVENNFVSINQVAALMALVNSYTGSSDVQILELQSQVEGLEGQVAALKQWRTDLRNELVEEAATNPALDGVTWVLANVYDHEAPFIVFTGITKVLQSNIVVSQVLADTMTFTSLISLAGPVRVLYFKDLENE